MSVIMLNKRIYEDCIHTLTHNKYFENGQKECLHWHMDSIYYSDNNVTPLETMFINLYNANMESYSARYNEPETNLEPLVFSNGHDVTKCQLLKHLQCIDYQIESGQRDTGSVARLETLIAALKNNIIEGIPEYQAAKWAQVV